MGDWLRHMEEQFAGVNDGGAEGINIAVVHIP